MNYRMKALTVLALASLCAAPVMAQPNMERLQAQGANAQATPPDAPVGADGVLRVCADPNNLPLSNEKGDGYENKIAAQMAHDFGWKLDYTYFPQRMGFVRRTLRAKDEATGRYKCDLIIGVPKNYGLTDTTRPYLHSTYAMVFRKHSDLASIKSPDDMLKMPADSLHKIRFGIFSQTPAVDWLLRNGLYDQVASYPIQTGDPQAYPGELIEHDLVGKKIDVAMVWGPIAGYFAKHAGGELDMVAFRPDPKIKFDYEISMGTRRGEKEWKEKVDNWIAGNQGKIDSILLSYDVPLVDKDGNVRVHAN